MAVLLDADVRARLAAAIDGLRAASSGVAWVAEPNLHVTVKFLGHVEADRLGAVGEALRGAVASVASFPFEVRGLGAFPTAARARVIWAGVGEGTAACVAAAELVDGALAPLGFPRETRPFSPHVTLGRVREPRRDERLAALLRTAAATVFGTVSVQALTLVRSDLSPRGARYTELASCQFRGHERGTGDLPPT